MHGGLMTGQPPGTRGGWWRFVPRAPASLLYIAITWALFVPLANPIGGTYQVDLNRVGAYVYRIPDLSEDFPRVMRSLATAPFLNHDSVQLVYITILVLLFGIVFEAREGIRRTVTLFVFGLIAGAFGSGILLHLLYPEVTSAPLYAYAWDRTWSGGSAGCFAIMGALAARSRKPWLFLALVVLWDLNWPYLRILVAGSGGPQFDLVWWHLPHSFTSAFHLLALPVGFLAARFWMRPVRRSSPPAPHGA